jgi:PAS domain S-box-containing protein
MFNRPRHLALKVTTLYTLCAGIWILGSDQLLAAIVQNPKLRVEISMFKGFFFVTVTGLLLYGVLYRIFRKLEREAQLRQRQAEALHQSEASLRRLGDNLPNGYVYQLATWPGGKRQFRYLSAGVERIHGVAVAEALKDSALLYRQVHPEDRQKLATAEAECQRAMKAFSLAIRIQGANHRLIWLRLNSAPSQQADGSVLWDGVALDITEHRIATEALHDSEQRYRQLFEMESDAVLLVDCETHQIVDANLSAQQLYGYPREEFIQLPIDSISAEPEKTRQTIGQTRAHIPLRWHRKKGGAVFPAEINTSIIQHQGRRQQLGAIRDITARQQVMNQLRETTQQLQNAQRIARLGSYVFDIQSQTWISSTVLDELFGLEATDSARNQASWLNLIHPEDRPGMQQHLEQEVLGRRQRFDREYRIIRVNDQKERWVHGLGELVLDEQDRPVQMIGTIQDITDHKQDEERINLQFSALASAANGIVITDRNGTIEWVNPAFTQLTGYSTEEAVGKNPRVLKSGEHPPEFYTNMWQTIKDGRVWHSELVNRRKDGSLYEEDMTVTPVKGVDGQIAHFVAIKQDVTKRRQLDSRLRQAQKMEAIGTLAGGIAHDFNNILAAMFGYASLLEEQIANNPAARENVMEIMRAGTRAKDLVQQILTFSRQQEQMRQPLHLGTIIKEVLKFLRVSMPSGIKISLALSDETPAVLANPTQIYQVLMNLATNALHAMGGQVGELAVNLAPFTADAEFQRLHPGLTATRFACLMIADTGCGMDARTKERIFEPFFTTKPVGEGTGLGLAVVHGIVQAHGGTISVDSSPGEGTVFRLCFPAHTNEQLEPDSTLCQAVAGQGQHILVVDDEKSLTTMFEQLLKHLNYRVTTSNSGSEAVELVRLLPNQFDLVITDLTMPELNGLGVARNVSECNPNLPVILMSGFSANTSEDQIRAAGIYAQLDKPVSITALGETVYRALNRR